MSVRLAISVEGPTEYEFCREVLREHLAAFAVYMEPKIVVTKRNPAGPNSTGGAIGIDRVLREIKPLLRSFDYVTTLYDFYGFKDRVAGGLPDTLCSRISERLGHPRHFIPYVQRYEFEALLFSAPEVIGGYLESPSLGRALADAVAASGGPEQINENPKTAPSARLVSLFSEHLSQRYDKPFHGPLLATEIGLAAIRSACPRFDAWLTQLERLTN